jgi:hypothetical protein
MTRSFAQIRLWLNAGLLALALAGCASLPPPTAELSAAQQALNRAEGADAYQYSPAALEQARGAFSRAQAAMSAGDEEEARRLALVAAADADLAYAESRAQVTQQEYRQRRQEVTGLRQRLQVDDGSLPPELAEIGPPALSPGGEALRLQQLDADPELSSYAPYERLRARQALSALLEAGRRERADAQYVAVRRIAAAELAARTEAMRRQVDQLERDRSDLLVEASRQDAEQARREAERLRVQAQIQAEEAQRLRAEADAAARARQQAEDLIIDVGGAEAERLKAARAREAELARQEAELLSEGQDDEGSGEEDESPR